MEQFEQLVAVFINWQTGLFCLSVYVITYVIRTVVESAWQGSAKSKLWNDVFLHLGPIGTGLVLGLVAKSYPWPEMVASVPVVKTLYTMLCGFSSGFAYGRFRALLKAKTGSDAGLPPGPTETTVAVAVSVQQPAAPVAAPVADDKSDAPKA